MWCRGTLAAIEDGKLKEWYDKKCLSAPRAWKMVRTPLEKIQRRVVVTLMTNDVHSRDIVDEMISEGVQSVDSFTWQKQLRFY